MEEVAAEEVGFEEDAVLENETRVDEVLAAEDGMVLPTETTPELLANLLEVLTPELLKDEDDALEVEVRAELCKLEDALSELLADEDEALSSQMPKAD